MKTSFTITAVLTTMSPLHITEPGDTRVDLNGKDVKGDAGFPCPRTTKMWLSNQPLLSGIAVDSDDGSAPSSTNSPVPCIPANSIRGQLRRQAAKTIMEALVSRGEALSINAYNVLQCGAATGTPDGNGPTVAEAVEADAHPYFGLFGGGPRLIRSNLRVDTALAVTPTSLPYLRPEFAGAMNGRSLLSVGWRRRNDDALMLTDVDAQGKILASFTETINQYQDAAMASKASKAKAKEEGEEDHAPDAIAAARGLSAFNAIEYVVPGTHFAVRLDLEGNEAQAGLLLAALLGVVQANRLGGDGRRGFGRFCLQSVVITENGEPHPALSRITEDTLAWEGRAGELVQAWEAAKQSITAGQLERFAKPGEKPAPAKKKAKAKDAAGPEAGAAAA